MAPAQPLAPELATGRAADSFIYVFSHILAACIVIDSEFCLFPDSPSNPPSSLCSTLRLCSASTFSPRFASGRPARSGQALVRHLEYAHADPAAHRPPLRCPPLRQALRFSALEPRPAPFSCMYTFTWFREGEGEGSFVRGGRCRFWYTGVEMPLSQYDHPVTIPLTFSH